MGRTATSLVLAWALGQGCNLGTPDDQVAAASTAPANNAIPSGLDGQATPLVGRWRFELDSPGGLLPFEVDIRRRPDGYEGELINGEEHLPLSSVRFEGKTLRLGVEHYDSVLEGEIDGPGNRFVGRWRRRAPKQETNMQATGERGATHRFERTAQDPGLVAGDWTMQFTEDDGSTFAGHAVLRAEADEVRGTILTDTGDYRFLEGQVVGGELRLSVFDGAHAFLFRAQMKGMGTNGEGKAPTQLVGDFWSRDTYHASFKASRSQGASASGLANPFEIVELTSGDGKMHFDFPMWVGPGAEPRRFTDSDPSLEGKVVLVDIFGTWCPNCNDQAPLLSQWQREYADRGLRIVGIAFEFSGEADTDMEMLGRYRAKYDIDYPLLLGGTSDKAYAGKQLPDLSKVAAYPTSVFVGRDGKVRKVYSGFSGPATGERHNQMLQAHRSALETLLAEPAPG